MTNNKIKYGVLAVSMLAIVGLATTAYAGARSGHFGFGHGVTGWSQKFSNIGIDSDQLKADIQTGQSFKEALANQDINQEDLLAQKKQYLQTKLAALVASGELTQEQADQRLEMINNHLTKKDGSKFRHRGFKQHHNKHNWPGFSK